MGETRDAARMMREEWGGALCGGLRPSIMTPSVLDLWTLQTADATGAEPGSATGSYRKSCSGAGEAQGRAERMVGCQVDRRVDRWPGREEPKQGCTCSVKAMQDWEG